MTRTIRCPHGNSTINKERLYLKAVSGGGDRGKQDFLYRCHRLLSGLRSSLYPASSPVSGGGASQHSADLVLDLGDQDLGQHNARDLRVGRWHGRKHANQWFVLRIKHLF